jgi:DNA polymerase-3 subunit delta
MSHQKILRDIAKGNYKPVYFLHGEEPYFIDLVERFATTQIIDESARDFDQTILYGKDSELQTIVNSAKRFPMMGDYQVISVRESQHIKKFDELIQYCENPQAQTILIFSHKKKLDARTAKKLTKNIEFFESKKLYENQIPGWVINQVESERLKISEKSAVLITEFLGNDLGKIANELKKLSISLSKDSVITPEIIEQNIGLSKDFNLFELSSSIANRDVVKANRICNHFAANQKNYPLILTIPNLYRLFSKIMGVYFSPSDNPEVIAKTIGVNKFFLKDYTSGKRNFSKRQIFNAISLMNEYDLKSKGYGSKSVSDGELLKELVFKIMH